MQILPNQSWTLPTQDNGPGAGIANIGNVFGDPMQNALQKQKAALTAREVAGQGQLGALFSHPGAVDNATASAAIANGVDPKTLGEVFRLTNNLNGGVDSDLAARAGAGIGQFTSTPLYQQRAEQAATARTAQSAQIAADAQARAAGIQAQSQLRVAGLEPVQVKNADGSVGWTTKAAIATGHAPQGATPLISPDMVKGAISAQGLLPEPGGAPAPAAPAHNWGPAHAGGSPSGPIVADPSWTPPPDPAAAPGGAPAMTDDQRQFIGLDTAPKFQVVGEDAFGNKQYGYPPPPGAAPAPTGVASPAEASQAINLHGEDFLATIDPQMAGQVRGIVAGDIPYPTGMLLKTPYGQKLATYVTQTDPSFNAADFAVRQKTRQAFATGPQGQAISSAGAALGHLGDFLNAVPALGNANTSIPGNDLYNSVKNAAKGGAAAAPLAAYDQVNHRLNGELEKYYTATGGTKEERQAGEALQGRNLSPSEIYASAIMLADNLIGKSDQYRTQYAQQMGPMAAAAHPIPEWSPQAKATLAKIQQMKDNFAKTGSYTGVGTLPGVTAKEAPVGAPAQSPVGTVKQWNGKSYARTPGDEYDQNSWREIPGGK